MMTGWGVYWLAWFTIGFGIPEAVALVRNVKDTLSYQIWGLEHINFSDPLNFANWTPVHWILAILLFGFTIWLGVHMIFGVWRL